MTTTSEENSSGNHGPKSDKKEEDDEVYFDEEEDFSAEMMEESEWEETNAFRWSFLQPSNIPPEGAELVIAGPPFKKDDEEYTGEEGKSPYLPVFLQGDSSRPFIVRLSRTRLISLREVMECGLMELPGRKVKIEHKEYDQGSGLEFTEKTGIADQDLLYHIQHQVEVDDPDYKEVDVNLDESGSERWPKNQGEGEK
ncbi:MAG: hypothetical protein ABEJ98_03760 [Candidatus Nanohaloarchaea archaeon]